MPGELQFRGPIHGATGSPAPFTADISAAQRVTDAHGRYAEAVRRGNVWSLSLAAGAATAYVGAAAGTPLLAIHNPANNNKNFELIAVAFGNRVVASAIGWTTLALWGGPSAIPTGTQTNPINMLSLATTGSGARGFANAALTGSTALGLLMPLASLFWGTSVGVGLAPGLIDVAGLVIATPGNQLAIGLSVAPASATYDVAMFWEEVPALA